MSNKIRKRIKIVEKNPNKLFIKWLTDWHNEAIKSNLNSRFSFQKALSSIKKYPLRLLTGRECYILDGFGNTICNMIDSKLEKTNIKLEKTDYDLLIKNISRNAKIMDIDTDLLEVSSTGQILTNGNNSKSPSKSDDSIDRIMAEFDLDNNDIIEMTRSRITENEEENTIKKLHNTNESIDDVSGDCIIMKPNSFEIIILVDTQEISGKKTNILDKTVSELINNNINYEIRRLSVGDFLWICRDELGNELVLPYIVERKRIDDLCNSIKDGRFTEQKYRLKKCGLPNKIYIIENYDSKMKLGIDINAIHQAAINTLVQHDFQIKFTKHHKHTIDYLNNLTKLFLNTYKCKCLSNKTKQNYEKLLLYKTFSKSSIKNRNFNISEIFLKQLIQLKLLTPEKALGIIKVYPTPYDLIKKYNLLMPDKNACEKLLENIEFGTLRKKIGYKLSKKLYDFYN